MIHSKASTLQLHKVQGSMFFTRLSVSRQGSKAQRLQENKFGVPQFHDPRVPYFQHFHGPRDPYCESQKVQVPDLQRVKRSRVLEIQGCRILRLQSSKVTRLQESKGAGFHGFKAPRFQSSGGTGFQKPFAGALAGMPRRNSLQEPFRTP